VHETTRIRTDPSILGGKPCIRGTRISVEFILELLAGGASHQEILGAYPQLNAEGLRAAIEYAAMALRDEVIWEIPVSA
jgi:uncharacterized protein (DUF433 family)